MQYFHTTSVLGQKVPDHSVLLVAHMIQLGFEVKVGISLKKLPQLGRRSLFAELIQLTLQHFGVRAVHFCLKLKEGVSHFIAGALLFDWSDAAEIVPVDKAS